jgi:GxxExxY protein
MASPVMIKEFANTIYRTLGSGHSERVYHNAMEVILRKNNIAYESERILPIEFEGHTIGNMRADLIINKKLIVELKSVKVLTPAMNQQTINYLNLTGLTEGLLVNFPLSADSCEFAVIYRLPEKAE